MSNENLNDGGKCPFNHGEGMPSHSRLKKTNQEWWPERLDLSLLKQHGEKSSPLGRDFDYKEAFEALDLDAVKEDLFALMTDSQDWWPADYGHYGPFFIRMAWHSAGTYRTADGRGGAKTGSMRFAPLNSWPDNGNLDKARLLLWPIKQKYGQSISWADLMILAGNCALESMGLKPFGFGGGREDIWEPEEDIYWGPEGEWLADERYSGDRELASPLAAVQMGLIYVNPEGPNGVPNPLASARDIRETFGRMAMNDEETVALIAGGHTFGKAHGAGNPEEYVGPAPEGAPIEQQSTGWKNPLGKGHSEDTITSGLEGAWTTTPAQWSNDYFKHLFGYEWELTKSPAGAFQWKPVGDAGAGTVPDAHVAGKEHAPMMFTSDLALREDPVYREVSLRFAEDNEAFAEAFARAWFKLTHRDMGPVAGYLGKDVPTEELVWQDPVPEGRVLSVEEEAELKLLIDASELSTNELVYTAWSSAATYRGSDGRGGANGARIRLEPMKDWQVNRPDQLQKVLKVYEKLQKSVEFTVSLADLIVLGGNVGVEQALEAAGYSDLGVEFISGRGDASQEQTDIQSVSYLEPEADAFRNYQKEQYAISAERMLIDQAQLLGLVPSEMVVLLGGMRVLGMNADDSSHGVFTQRVGVLTNDYFVNLLELSTTWEQVCPQGSAFAGRSRSTGELLWTGTRVDLIVGAHSELRAIAEVYACDDGARRFAEDFASVWAKVMSAGLERH